MPKLTLKECASLLETASDIEMSLNAVCVDTRLLEPGDLFFALPGSHVDGHSFLEQAAALGAGAFVVEENYNGPTYEVPVIRVPNVLAALQTLAKKVLARSHSQVVAVTGSLGKTTTKEFLATLMKHKFCVAQSPGNSNSQIGLPLAILNHTTGGEDVVILEMGLTEAGHIAKLVDIAPPDVAVITTTALVHVQNFNSLEAIGTAKAEIFSHPKTRLGILHEGIPNFDELCHGSPCLKVSFSTKSLTADYYLVDSAESMQIFSRHSSPAKIGPLKVPGKHNRHNFLAAVVVARHFGMTWEEINIAMQEISLPERRLEIVEKNGVTFVNDSYNASEQSTKAALESLPDPHKKGKKIAVLGEMLELGRFSDRCHRSVGEHALKFVDAVVCYGAGCRPIEEVWRVAGRPVSLVVDKHALLKIVQEFVSEGDVVLLKGSRSKEMWKILDEF